MELDLYQKKWSGFLTSIREGVNEKKVHSFMEGKYRDKGYIYLGNSGAHEVVYLIDDAFQVRFSFDGDDKLVRPGVLEKRQKWLRFPDGSILFQ